MRTAKWWMLAVTCLSVIVVSLDLTVLNIALPSISAALHASTADLQWIVDAYSLAFAGVMLSAGVIGDRVGRRRVLLAGLAVFLAASVWCALSSSVGELIAGRVLMGLGAATVFPLSLAITSAAFSDAERPRAIGILTAAVALGLPLGPVIGGVLLQHFAWNSVFWINVPAVCLTLAAGFFLVPQSRNPAAPALDVPGALLSAAAVTSLVWGVINGPEHGWAAPATGALLAGSAVLFAAFGFRERRAACPLIDPALFRDPQFTWGTVATIGVSVALFGILFTVPQYLQSVLGDDPLSAGLRLLPMIAGLLVAGGAASPAVRVLGTRLTVTGGLALLTAGLAVLSQVHLATGYAVVATGLALCGLGTGASIAAAMDAVMAAAGGDEAGAGAAVNSTLRQVGGAIAVAVLGSVLSAGYAGNLRPALAALPAGDAATARASIAGAVQVAARLPSGGWLRAAAATAFLNGLAIVMLSCAGLAAVTALTSLRYLPGRVAAPASAVSGSVASSNGEASSGGPASPQPPAGATPPAGTRR
jgi:EmrB/QacA subfamily drug resistance transporter